MEQITFRQMTNNFSTNAFCPLSNSPRPPLPTLPFLKGKNQDGQTKPKSSEKYTPVVHCIWSFEGISYNNLWDAVTRCFISLIFRASYNIWKKDFRHEFSFFNRFTQHPKIFKNGCLDETSTFRGELLGKSGVTFFHIKNKLKPEIFNDKKSWSALS